MKKVLILIDVWGWAHDFVSRGIIKYSTKFKCYAKKPNEVKSWGKKFDVIFPLNYDVWTCVGERRKWLRGKKYCVGVRSGSLDSRLKLVVDGKLRLAKFHGIGCNSYGMYLKLKGAYPKLETIQYTPNAVDVEIFKAQTLEDRFQVGWAGTVERGCKRVEIARKLKYPVKVKCQRFGKYFQKGISRQPMVDFYRSIDCLVCTSSSEGMNNVVLEAAASGLPIVSTAAGDIPRLISKEWLVPVNPQKVVIREMNRKLTLLKNNLALRRKVGRRNREEVVKNWGWQKQVKNYETMFESALKR